jgi:hypothetical protein
MRHAVTAIPPSSGFRVTWHNEPLPAGHATCTGAIVADETKFRFPKTGLCSSIACWGRTRLATTANQEFTILLHGELSEPYVGDAQDLLATILPRYRSQPVDQFARALRGSYILVVVDRRAENIHLITDRNGTRKAFCRAGKTQHWIGTTTDDLMPKDPDPAGIASFLSNDFCFNGRTTISGVTMLERASVHSLDLGRLRSEPYWMPDYDAKFTGVSPAELEDAYLALLRQAIRRALSPDGPLLVSLSGGIDSRAIFAVLTSDHEARKRLTAFTYGDETDEDVIVARRLCAQARGPHLVLRYGGDIVESIKRNGCLSEGIVSFYTHGLDGLFALEKTLRDGATMFVGDIAFRQGKSTFSSVDEMLTQGVGIHSPVHVPRWFGWGSEQPEAIEARLAGDVADLKRKISEIADLGDANHFLLLDQRQNFGILPWREFYSGRFMRVANPFIDEEILDFAARVPSHLANDKRLHRAAITRLASEFGLIPYALSGIKNQRAFSDIVRNRRAILDFVDDFESSLDNVVPRGVVKQAVNEYCQRVSLDRYKLPGTLRHAVDATRWQMGAMRVATARDETSNRGKRGFGIPKLAGRQLLKLLSLRYFFRR